MAESRATREPGSHVHLTLLTEVHGSASRIALRGPVLPAPCPVTWVWLF